MLDEVSRLFQVASESALPVVRLLRESELTNSHYEKVKLALRDAQRALVLKVIGEETKDLLWVNTYFSRHFELEFQLSDALNSDPDDYIYAPAHFGIDMQACEDVHAEIARNLQADHLSAVLRKDNTPMLLEMAVSEVRGRLALTFEPLLRDEEMQRPWSERLAWYVDTVFKNKRLEAHHPSSLLYVHLGVHRIAGVRTNPLQSAGVYLMFSSRDTWGEFREPLVVALRAFLNDLLLTHVWTSEQRAADLAVKQRKTLDNMATSIAHEFKNHSATVMSQANALSTLAWRLDLDDRFRAQAEALHRQCLVINSSAAGYLYSMRGPPDNFVPFNEPHELTIALLAAASIAIHLFGSFRHAEFKGHMPLPAAISTLTAILGCSNPLSEPIATMAIAPFVEVVRNVRPVTTVRGAGLVEATVSVRPHNGLVVVEFEQMQIEASPAARDVFDSPSLERYCAATALGLGLSVEFPGAECSERGGADAGTYLVKGKTIITVPKLFRHKGL